MVERKWSYFGKRLSWNFKRLVVLKEIDFIVDPIYLVVLDEDRELIWLFLKNFVGRCRNGAYTYLGALKQFSVFMGVSSKTSFKEPHNTQSSWQKPQIPHVCFHSTGLPCRPSSKA